MKDSVNNDGSFTLTTGDASRETQGNVNPQTIRNWADSGRLPSIRTAGGVRLFRRADVKRVAAERLGTKR